MHSHNTGNVRTSATCAVYKPLGFEYVVVTDKRQEDLGMCL
jgi:hypothetical protein